MSDCIIAQTIKGTYCPIIGTIHRAEAEGAEEITRRLNGEDPESLKEWAVFPIDSVPEYLIKAGRFALQTWKVYTDKSGDFCGEFKVVVESRDCDTCEA